MIYPHSQIWTPETIGDIHARASGGYRLSGFRPMRDVPSFDDLVFLAAGLTRFPLEGYKEKCRTETTIGRSSVASPLVLEVPIYVASSPGLADDVRLELARGSSLAHTALSTGGGGAIRPEERRAAHKVIYEVPSVTALKDLPPGAKVDAIQFNVRERVGTDALRDAVKLARTVQGAGVPILVSLPAGRVEDEVKAAVGAGADGIVLLGLTTTVGLTPPALLDYCRLPMMAAIPRAREALRDSKALGEVSIVAGNGIRHGADAAKALALGADAVRIDEAALIALGYYASLQELLGDGRGGVVVQGGTRRAMGNRAPAARSARDDVHRRKLKSGSGIRVAKFVNSMIMEVALLARSMGKGDVHSLEYEDLAALTIESSMISGVRLAGE